jgi:glycine/D-amino acid oxidase-like deaminating enzyme
VSTAYYLAQLGVSSLVIEQTRIAAAASGKAGGFLAREWGDGPTIQLHQKSYDLHRTLATELRVESYRQVNTLEVNGNRKGKNIASWLDGRVSSTLMDTNTSQVDTMHRAHHTVQTRAHAQLETHFVAGHTDGTHGEAIGGCSIQGSERCTCCEGAD